MIGPGRWRDACERVGDLAESYWAAGRTGEAIAIFERVAADRERLLGPGHPDTLIARNNLAMAKRGENSPTGLRNQALIDLAS